MTWVHVWLSRRGGYFIAKYFGSFVHRTKKGGGGGRFSDEDHEHRGKINLSCLYGSSWTKQVKNYLGVLLERKEYRRQSYESTVVVVLMLLLSPCSFLVVFLSIVYIVVFFTQHVVHKHTCLYFETSKLLIYGNISSITRC